MKKKITLYSYFTILAFFLGLSYSSSQTTLAKEDIAIIGVNTDNEDFTFLLRTDITTNTEIHFSDNEVNAGGTGIDSKNEGVVLFTAAMDYPCGTVISYLNNSAEFTTVNGSFILGNGGDEVLAFQGYDAVADTWTTFLHANVELTPTLPVGFTAADIVDGTNDNREYNGSTANPTWADLNTIANYNEGANFGSINLNTTAFTCAAACTPTHTITSYNPTSGPIDTHVTIIGTGFTAGTTVAFNGNPANIISQDNTTLVVEVTTGSTTGVITVTESGCGLDTIGNFTLIETSGTCTASTFTDVIITEVYDSDGGNNWYMELYNPTSVAINLDAPTTDYAIERYANIGGGAPSRTIDLTGTIAANSVFTINLGDSADNCIFTADFTDAGAGINANDEIRLLKNGADLDVVHAPNNDGYSILRDVNATGPATVFNATDWTTNNTESCADIGTFNPPASGTPVVNTQPVDVTNCSNYTFSVTATAGNGGALTYQWKYNDGTSANWFDVTNAAFNPGTVTGETTNALAIVGIDIDGYQFYCEVTENALCTVASNAAQVSAQSTTWNGIMWNNGAPNINVKAIINGNYDTSVNGSFSACSLTVNATYTLTILNNDYIEIQNDIVSNGDIEVETQGAVVQINDNATASGTGTMQVTKTTAPMNNWYEYTYWSTPVSGITIDNALTDADPTRRFWFNGENYLDATQETNNNNATVPGQDDIDDDGNDWTPVAGTDIMQPGVGYASTHLSTLFTGPPMTPPPYQFDYVFIGAFNNGIFNVPVYRNDSETADTNWNFIGNPYPSAIRVTDFFNENARVLNANGAIDGAIHFWSQDTPPDANNNGNENLNFTQSDYATINSVGGTSPSLDGNVPNGFIPSGQGFFVSMSDTATPISTTGDISTANVVFNNSMRVTGNNTQFFRIDPSSQDNKLWLNLLSDNGVFSQILVGYVNGASNGYDGAYYDAPRNLSTGAHSILYSRIENSDKKFAIQGKSEGDLTLEEVIKLGFYTSINEATIYTLSIAQLEGQFLNENTIYLIDHLLNTVHDLSTDYAFTSETGEFNNRFEIVFTADLLSVNDNELTEGDLTINELDSGEVNFNISNGNVDIVKVEIIDMLGRIIYQLNGSSSNETYNLSKLSKAPYIARVTLSNELVITKKAIKRF